MRGVWNAMQFLITMTVYLLYVVVGLIIVSVAKLVCYGEKSQRALRRSAKIGWLHLTRAMFSRYFPHRVFIRYNPTILKRNRNVIISNHLTEYDWLFVCCVLHCFERFEDICIILKMSLRSIPLLGYGMKFFQFIFLNRKISKDRELIMSGASRLKREGKYDLLLFPEGTYIDKYSHPKSHKWSVDASIEVEGRIFDPEEVLIPRTTGFKILRENIRDDMEGIIDITMIGNPHIKYPNDVFSYWDVIVNKSQKVNFMFFLDYIPNSDSMDGNDFLLKLFEKKEKMISEFKRENGDRCIRSMEEFKGVADSLVCPQSSHRDVEIDLSSHWGPFFYVMFIASSGLVLGAISRLCWK
ncbi:lysophospholipid acyltransferase [Encephalitozoon hellem ATCC 50504]|uniref:Lysocardiolipin acyltransferase n=1 Tax=Encephalitozoon hellem TaxID=27973 RepID=A0A9Q9CBJ5_ENCHE|nr:lysophospholipid acyltransferase [Encephalitozoon hellem ATCC 50504]AFM99220.1 lysophospholipid acyltransferase [Encephalitozoon hellem ATCC 50504]UTX44207.1 lysocardiolipin acyltransferase [Encephalitozoon hellem]WEL39698.1 lysocardiolipin acyltransferase [Encephalitozoon hellem]|eukprot:XP_003888201.1 lysophospholipid acyltransferase [Encephalitozoon hellem ATCC 50504]